MNHFSLLLLGLLVLGGLGCGEEPAPATPRSATLPDNHLKRQTPQTEQARDRTPKETSPPKVTPEAKGPGSRTEVPRVSASETAERLVVSQDGSPSKDQGTAARDPARDGSNEPRAPGGEAQTRASGGPGIIQCVHESPAQSGKRIRWTGRIRQIVHRRADTNGPTVRVDIEVDTRTTESRTERYFVYTFTPQDLSADLSEGQQVWIEGTVPRTYNSYRFGSEWKYAFRISDCTMAPAPAVPPKALRDLDSQALVK